MDNNPIGNTDKTGQFIDPTIVIGAMNAGIAEILTQIVNAYFTNGFNLTAAIRDIRWGEVGVEFFWGGIEASYDKSASYRRLAKVLSDPRAKKLMEILLAASKVVAKEMAKAWDEDRFDEINWGQLMANAVKDATLDQLAREVQKKIPGPPTSTAGKKAQEEAEAAKAAAERLKKRKQEIDPYNKKPGIQENVAQKKANQTEAKADLINSPTTVADKVVRKELKKAPDAYLNGIGGANKTTFHASGDVKTIGGKDYSKGYYINPKDNTKVPSLELDKNLYTLDGKQLYDKDAKTGRGVPRKADNIKYD